MIGVIRVEEPTNLAMSSEWSGHLAKGISNTNSLCFSAPGIEVSFIILKIKTSKIIAKIIRCPTSLCTQVKSVTHKNTYL